MKQTLMALTHTACTYDKVLYSCRYTLHYLTLLYFRSRYCELWPLNCFVCESVSVCVATALTPSPPSSSRWTRRLVTRCWPASCSHKRSISTTGQVRGRGEEEGGGGATMKQEGHLSETSLSIMDQVVMSIGLMSVCTWGRPHVFVSRPAGIIFAPTTTVFSEDVTVSKAFSDPG